MRGRMKDNETMRKEEELLSLLNSGDPVEREQAQKDWNQFLMEHPQRQINLFIQQG